MVVADKQDTIKLFLETLIFTKNLEYTEENTTFTLFERKDTGIIQYTITTSGKNTINIMRLTMKQIINGKIVVSLRQMENTIFPELIKILDKYDEFALYRSSNGRPSAYEFHDVEMIIKFLAEVEHYI